MPRSGPPPTVHGYQFSQVASALQKACRRGEEANALYWAAELDLSGLGEYLWKRMRIICSEDVGVAWPEGPAVVRALYDNWATAKKDMAKGRTHTGAPLFIAHAIILMCRAPKTRVVDHAAVWAWRRADHGEKLAVPDEAFDMHTSKGRRLGRGIDHFFAESCRLHPHDVSIDDPYRDLAREALKGGPDRGGQFALDLESDDDD